MAQTRAQSKSFDLGDYVEVKDRVKAFKADHPNSRIENEMVGVEVIGNDAYIIIRAEVYLDPETDKPAGVGHSWMKIPGSTPYTRGSEIENAETSAVGRALAFLGYGIDKSLASRNEVEGKINEQPDKSAPDPLAEKKKKIRQLATRVAKELVPDVVSDYKELLDVDYGVSPANPLTNEEEADEIIGDLELRLADA